jgi:hypothetical protein
MPLNTLFAIPIKAGNQHFRALCLPPSLSFGGLESEGNDYSTLAKTSVYLVRLAKALKKQGADYRFVFVNSSNIVIKHLYQ